ncbi:gem-associated protein 2-like [Daphnia pulicaria]|uniref:gem-associated protein 2-like n=1 Tax=Daphnia pulicaria TaxID=35523 RepID=UPI001EEBE879|nr:gem-associated protein 2-like [Daphnia pulicaria]
MDEFLHKALYVEETDEDIDFESAPSTGQEYLRRVIVESRKCEAVVVADMKGKKLKAQTVKYTTDSGCPPAPEVFLPSKEWQQFQVSQFSCLRSRMAKHLARLKKQGIQMKPNITLPAGDKEKEWSVLCYGNPEDEKPCAGTPPMLPIILSLNQFMVETLLEYNVQWLEETNFTQQRGQWLYALLAKLEKPLKPEMCSLIRTLARLCSTFRVQLASVDDPLLAQLNLFICLVGRYFDQSDLADPMK